MPPLTDSQKHAIDQALSLRQEALDFHKAWPALNTQDDLTPAFTWTQLERQLRSLAVNSRSAMMASDLVSATRKQAGFKPAEMVLREILCVAGALMDESFPALGSSDMGPSDRGLSDRGLSDRGEAPMT